MHLQHAMVFRRADRVGYLSVNRRELHPTRAESFHDLAKVRLAEPDLTAMEESVRLVESIAAIDRT